MAHAMYFDGPDVSLTDFVQTHLSPISFAFLKNIYQPRTSQPSLQCNMRRCTKRKPSLVLTQQGRAPKVLQLQYSHFLSTFSSLPLHQNNLISIHFYQRLQDTRHDMEFSLDSILVLYKDSHKVSFFEMTGTN